MRATWRALDLSFLRDAIANGERALAAKNVSAMRRSASALRCTDEPETLADIAEDGTADELAPHIEGARVDDGVLVLSPEHERLIEKGASLLARLRGAIGANR